MSQFFNKNILLGVSSSVAIYKACEIISLLKKEGATVRVIMTENATNFIQPALFEALTAQPCLVDTFAGTAVFDIHHISWAKWADLVILAPAGANLLAKAAHGLADDLLTTTLLATKAPILCAPAMNTAMLENPRTIANVSILKKDGWTFIEPDQGMLACGDLGKGKLASPETIIAEASNLFAQKQELSTIVKDLSGKTILVSAGPTREAIDPVRYISNGSSGKMGYACAQAAQERGARVILVSGPTNLPVPDGVTFCPIESAAQMYNEISTRFNQADWVIMAAAVADFTPAVVAAHKIKKSGEQQTLSLVPTKDILADLGQRKSAKQVLCGFAMETQNLLVNGQKKLKQKNLDMICCNPLKEEGAGFAVDTNHLTLITKTEQEELPFASKYELANQILDRLQSLNK